MNNTRFNNFINDVSSLLVYNRDIYDSELDCTKVNVLARHISNLLKYAIKHSQELELKFDLSNGIEILDANNSSHRYCFIFIDIYMGYTEVKKGPRITLDGDGVNIHSSFYIKFSDLVKMLDMVVSNLGDSYKAYFLLKHIDLDAFKQEVIKHITDSAGSFHVPLD